MSSVEKVIVIFLVTKRKKRTKAQFGEVQMVVFFFFQTVQMG